MVVLAAYFGRQPWLFLLLKVFLPPGWGSRCLRCCEVFPVFGRPAVPPRLRGLCCQPVLAEVGDSVRGIALVVQRFLGDSCGVAAGVVGAAEVGLAVRGRGSDVFGDCDELGDLVGDLRMGGSDAGAREDWGLGGRVGVFSWRGVRRALVAPAEDYWRRTG